MKFEFTPPSSLTAGKVKLTIPSEVLAWADEIAATNESTREAVLGQAIRFAFTSAVEPQPKPARKRKA